MSDDIIYLDNHATTRCDPRVIEAMLPVFSSNYGNAHSPHALGLQAKQIWEQALAEIAECVGAMSDEVIITSGATEANNLALFGVALHPRQRKRHIISATTEHPAVLEPLQQLESLGFRITRLKVAGHDSASPGNICLNQLAEAIDEDTCIVSLMAANNEIGTLYDLPAIANLCHAKGALLHTDATQAIGLLPIDVESWGVDLLSASGHKIYAPKGVGFLYTRRRGRRVRLLPRQWGGGQQAGLRGGTVDVPGAIGLATALRLCVAEIPTEAARCQSLIRLLWQQLQAGIPGIELNGPPLGSSRLPNNLNVCFPLIEGESLMSTAPQLAISSGAACSSVDPAPSHVLTAIGRDESQARRSLRFGVGRFNTKDEIVRASAILIAAYQELKNRYSG